MERLQGVEGVRPTAFSTAYTYHKMKRIIQEFVNEGLHERAKVLDVGCGRGHDLLRLSERFEPLSLQMFGIDVVVEDLIVARRRVAELQSEPSISFLMSLVERLPFRDDTFNAVICSEVVEHLPDPDVALREIARVMKEGGVLALTTPNAGNKLHKLRKFLPGGMKAKADEWREMQEDINRQRRGVAGVNLPHVTELTSTQWCEKCRNCRFEVVERRRGSLLFGDPYLDQRPALWAMSVLLDRVLDHISDDWSWQILIKARKRTEGSVME